MTRTEPQMPEQGIVLAMVLINAFSTPLMLSAVNVALPSIATDLNLSAVAISWIPMAYLMATAMFILIFGRLSDLYGRKRIFLIGSAAAIATSCLAALAGNASTLLLARFLQGSSAAMLYATQMALVSSVFHPSRRGRAIGIVVSSVYFGLATGPVIGGIVTDTLGWRFNFLLQIPLALPVLLLGTTKVRQEWRVTGQTALDIRGTALYCTSILLFCLGVSQLPTPEAFGLIAAGVLIMFWFFRHSNTAPFPLWDVRLFFSNRVFTLSCVASLIMYSATYANVVLMSLYLQYLMNLPPDRAGLIMMVQPVSMALLSPLMGRLSDRHEPGLLASAGMAVTAIGLLMLASLPAQSSIPFVVVALLCTGIGFSLFSSPNSNAIMGSVDRDNLGSASGALATTRVIGQLFSMVLVTLAMTLIVGNTRISGENLVSLQNAISLSFAISAAICIPGIALSLFRGRVHQRREGSNG